MTDPSTGDVITESAVADKYCPFAVVHTYEGVHDSLAAPKILAAIEADLDRLELTADEVTGEHE